MPAVMRRETLDVIHWLATSNYDVTFQSDSSISERVIFPESPNESRGMEDARFVRFVEDDGSVSYYATYTAYDGHDILPQLIETPDFLHFGVRTLNGALRPEQGDGAVPPAHRREVRHALAPRRREPLLPDLGQRPILERGRRASRPVATPGRSSRSATAAHRSKRKRAGSC